VGRINGALDGGVNDEDHRQEQHRKIEDAHHRAEQTLLIAGAAAIDDSAEDLAQEGAA
jgi:hypothetical protein